MCGAIATQSVVETTRRPVNAIDAVVKRINRRLANANIKLRVSKRGPERSTNGQFYTFNTYSNEIVETFVNILDLAAQLGLETKGLLEGVYGTCDDLKEVRAV